MSASPPTQSTKRPLEETSSPSRTSDQPDAKRPALDKILRGGDEEEEFKGGLPSENGHSDLPDLPAIPDLKTDSKTNGENTESKDDQQDIAALDTAAETKTVASTQSGGASAVPAATTNPHDETAWIHIRAVITSPEAATIIGKGGENVSKIRQMSNAKCTVSDYQKGAIERILTVSGSVDAVAKVRICLQPLSTYDELGLTAAGFWFDHPYPEQRTSHRGVEPPIQDLPT